VILPKYSVDKSCTAHANTAMNFPVGNNNSYTSQSTRPRDHARINRVNKRSIQAEENRGIDRLHNVTQPHCSVRQLDHQGLSITTEKPSKRCPCLYAPHFPLLLERATTGSQVAMA